MNLHKDGVIAVANSQFMQLTISYKYYYVDRFGSLHSQIIHVGQLYKVNKDNANTCKMLQK